MESATGAEAGRLGKSGFNGEGLDFLPGEDANLPPAEEGRIVPSKVLCMDECSGINVLQGADWFAADGSLIDLGGIDGTRETWGVCGHSPPAPCVDDKVISGTCW